MGNGINDVVVFCLVFSSVFPLPIAMMNLSRLF